MLDVKLFSRKPFLAAAIGILVAMMGIGTALFLLTLWLQYVEEYTPMQAGLRMLPAGIAVLIGALSAARLMVSAAPPERAGMAAAIEETCYELGVALGVAFLGTIAATAYRYGLTDLGLPQPQASIVDESIGGAYEVSETLGRYILDDAKAAFTNSISLTSSVSAVLIAIATLIALRLIPQGFRADAKH